MPRSGLFSNIEIGRDGNVGLGAPSMTISSPLGPGVPDADIVYGSDDGNTYAHDLSDGSLVHTFTEVGDNGGDVDTSAITNSYIAYGGTTNNVYVHDAFDGSLVYTLTESSDRVYSLDLSDSYIAYGGEDSDTYVHDLSDGSLVYTLTETSSSSDVEGVGISESFVAYGDDDEDTYVHNLSNGSLEYQSNYQGNVTGVEINESFYAIAMDSYGSDAVRDTSGGGVKHRFAKPDNSKLDSEEVGLSKSLCGFGTSGNAVYVYKLSDGSLKYNIDVGSTVFGVSLSESFIAYTRFAEDDVVVRNVSDKSLEYTLKESSNDMKTFALRPGV